ncbi:MAG: hypothetical protein NC314_00430 [Roseburia sp.]|nr:hypothetical protein [Ruminococcus sp.]MCM1241278.1 hypothetical protein [Roseburia sp.]
MDFNQIPLGFGLAYMADNMIDNQFSNLSDDEKREYIERHRSGLSKSELDKMTASLGKDEDEGPDLRDPVSLFNGPSIG